jgi:hypothetical protein
MAMRYSNYMTMVDAQAETIQRRTYCGQAAWALDDEHNCNACVYLQSEKTGSRCGKFRALMGKWGPKIPADAAACRYFTSIPEKPESGPVLRAIMKQE